MLESFVVLYVLAGVVFVGVLGGLGYTWRRSWAGVGAAFIVATLLAAIPLAFAWETSLEQEFLTGCAQAGGEPVVVSTEKRMRLQPVGDVMVPVWDTYYLHGCQTGVGMTGAQFSSTSRL